MSLIPSTLVPQWFVRNRGKALSLMSLGNVAASTLFPPLNNIFITHMGIRFTWRIWAALLIIFMAPIGWIFVRNRPEDMGCLPDGKAISNDTQNALEDAKSDYDNEYPWTLKEAMKTHAFWLMLFCMIFPIHDQHGHHLSHGFYRWGKRILFDFRSFHPELYCIDTGAIDLYCRPFHR